MLLIPCPWCGPRPEDEFVFGEDASVQPPAEPLASDDAAWTDYLYFRENAKGPHKEWWFHSTGCHGWFALTRDTVSHAILAVETPGNKEMGGDQNAEDGTAS
jgi:heterotetrameric sarcosine oxidase delta subunit